MNIKLIKHIAYTDFRWKLKSLIILPIGAMLLYLILKFFGADADLFDLIIALGFLLSFILSITSSIIPHANNQARLPGQSGSFSWNYIHSIAHDRKSFLIGHCLGGVLSSFDLIGFCFWFLFIVPKNDNVMPVKTITFLTFIFVSFFVIIFRLVVIYSTIQVPRRLYYQYNNKNGLVPFFIKNLELTHRVVHYTLLFLTLFLIIVFSFKFGPVFGIAAAALCCLLLVTMLFRYTLRVWADERLFRWLFKEKIKYTLIYGMSLVVILCANVAIHGEDFLGPSDEVFRLIEEENLKEIKKLKLGKDVLSLRNNYGQTPFLFSVYLGEIEMAEYFLQNGSHLEEKVEDDLPKNLKDTEGMTALVLAMKNNRLALLNLLINRGASVEAVDHAGLSALMWASINCNLQAMETLLKAGAKINSITAKGNTALFIASANRCLTGMLYLIEMGADTNIKNKENMNYQEFMKSKDPLFYDQFQFYKQKIATEAKK